MRNPSPEIQRAAKKLAYERKDPFRETDVIGSEDVADQILHDMSQEERAGRVKRSGGTSPELPQFNAPRTPRIEKEEEERLRLKAQRERADAAFHNGNAEKRGEHVVDRISTGIVGDERVDKVRAQALLFRQTAEEMTDPTEKRRWEEKAEIAEAGILVEDGDVSLARIKAMKESRQERRSDMAEENLYDSKGPLGKLGIRLRELFKPKG